MTLLPSRQAALAVALAAGCNLGPLALLPRLSAQTAPAADQALAAQMVENSPRSRHLAPHDTFYLLSYVAVKTEKGVEGFDPGQEVHLVEVRRDRQTLLVSNGHAQVEVSPSNLTNDIDIAALVRQKDQSSQARIAQHIKDEQIAYSKYEREAADATASDLAQRRDDQRKQDEEARRGEQAPVAQTAAPASNPANNGYYGDGGYGYGSPYSYFSGPSSVIVAPATNTAAPSAAAPAPGRVPVNPATVGTAGRPPR